MDDSSRRRRASRRRGDSSPIAVVSLRAAGAHCVTDDPGGAIVADRGGAARPAQGLRHAPHSESVVDAGLAVRDGPNSAARSSPRSRGSTAGRSPCWRVTRTSTAVAGPPTPRRRLRGSSTRKHVPPARCASGRRAGLCDRYRGREGRYHSHGARALAAIYQASVPFCSIIIRKVFGVAGAGIRPPPAALSLCLAVGRLGLAAGRGRHRGGLPRRADAAPIATSCASRSRSGSTAIARRSVPPRHS